MENREKRMKEILEQKIQISGPVEEKLKDTYELIRERQPAAKEKKKKIPTVAAAVILVFLASTSVYAAFHSEFFEGMFGNKTKESVPAEQRSIDNGKGGKVAVVVPSKEFVDVDEERAEELLEAYVMEKPVVKTIGSHTLTVENFLYNEIGGLMYFTLERKEGVIALKGDEETNLEKGARFTEDADFYFTIHRGEQVIGTENIYVDTQRSTQEKMYFYSYFLWSEWEGEEAQGNPTLEIEQYPCTRGEQAAMSEEEAAEMQKKTKKESISLTDKAPMPIETVDLKEKGTLNLSPVAMSFDVSLMLGVEGELAMDPGQVKRVEIQYRDGSSYVVEDKEAHINNTGYVLGTGTVYKIAFNRLVDVEKIEKVMINDVIISVK